MTGPRIKLVDFASATHGRDWEEDGSYIKPMHRDHSNLVKFSHIDDDYTTVLRCLSEIANTARATIMKRFLCMSKISYLPFAFLGEEIDLPIILCIMHSLYE